MTGSLITPGDENQSLPPSDSHPLGGGELAKGLSIDKRRDTRDASRSILQLHKKGDDQ